MVDILDEEILLILCGVLLDTYSYSQLLRFFLFGLIISVLGPLFSFSLTKIIELASPLFFEWKIYHPIVGVLFLHFIIYPIAPSASDEGISSYIKFLSGDKNSISIKSSIIRFFATIITLLSFGSGGLLGTVIGISVGFAKAFSDFVARIKIQDLPGSSNQRIIFICAASSVITSLIGAPFCSGILAVEILKRANMKYSDLFPSLIASCCTFLWLNTFNLTPAIKWPTLNFSWETHFFLLSSLMGIITGIFSYIYVGPYVYLRSKWKVKPHFKYMLIAALVLTLTITFMDPRLCGLSSQILLDILHGQLESYNYFNWDSWALGFLFIFLALWKVLLSSLTVGTGMGLGVAGPAIIVGALLGTAVTLLFGYAPGSPANYCLIISGISGMMSGSLNIPLSSSVLGAEIGGGPGDPSSILASVISFQLSRGITVYRSQLEEKVD